MAKPRAARKQVTSDPDRQPGPRSPRGVTSDPDRGVAVNSGTDPQRPGTAPRPAADTPAASKDTSVPADRFEATHQAAATGRGEDVERGPRGGADDAAE
jgi:hypothetical protein